VKYYFSAADVLVQPYKTATQSGVTQIAYNFELPMIVTDVGGLPEIVPDGRVGYVCRPDAAGVADALVRICEGDTLARFRSARRTAGGAPPCSRSGAAPCPRCWRFTSPLSARTARSPRSRCCSICSFGRSRRSSRASGRTVIEHF